MHSKININTGDFYLPSKGARGFCHLPVDVVFVAALQEVEGERGCVAKRLDDGVHVTCVAKVTQTC